MTAAVNWVDTYHDATAWIAGRSPGPDKFAHSYVGLAIWLIAALALRRPLRSQPPLLIVLAIELANEAMDRLAHGSWMWADTLPDIVATVFWPLILMIALRRVPALRA